MGRLSPVTILALILLSTIAFLTTFSMLAVKHHIEEFNVAAVQCRDNVLTWGRIASGDATLAEDGTVTETPQPPVDDETKPAAAADPPETQP